MEVSISDLQCSQKKKPVVSSVVRVNRQSRFQKKLARLCHLPLLFKSVQIVQLQICSVWHIGSLVPVSYSHDTVQPHWKKVLSRVSMCA